MGPFRPTNDILTTCDSLLAKQFQVVLRLERRNPLHFIGKSVFACCFGMVINGELPEGAFKRFELAVKYVSAEELEALKDGLSQALTDWLDKRAKEKGWKVRNTVCPVCSEEVSSYEGSDKMPFIVCPRCIWKRGKLGAVDPTPAQP